MAYLFSFAAKGLQSYVLEGDQLKTMTGATELIDRLCRGDFLTKLLDKTGIDGEVLQGAAGSARIQIDLEEGAKRLARVWPIFCHRWAPGLEVVQSLQQIQGNNLSAAIHAAEEEMRLNRNFLPTPLPLATPVMERCRRTGRAAIGSDDEGTPTDAALLRKIEMRNSIKSDLTTLQRYFGFKSIKEVPQSFEEISGSERAYLAIIHADGNGLGKMFMSLAEASKGLPDQDKVQDLFSHLSSAVIEEGTQAAVKAASLALGLEEGKLRPLQPIVLAGDDLTLVCRADLAWDFTTAFLRNFGDEMTTRLRTVKANEVFPAKLRDTLPDTLSAGASIVYVSNHYPFSLGYALAESLASRAKSRAKELNPQDPPASVFLHRISGAWAPTEFYALSETLLKGDGMQLSAGPYFLGDPYSPTTTDLEKLWSALSDLPSGSVRELVALLATESSAVEPSMERMLTVADERHAASFRDTVRELGLDSRLASNFHGEKSSPLPDAWTLRVMSGKKKAAKVPATTI